MQESIFQSQLTVVKARLDFSRLKTTKLKTNLNAKFSFKLLKINKVNFINWKIFIKLMIFMLSSNFFR